MVSFPCLYLNIKVHNGLETAKLNLVTRTIRVQKWKKIYGLIAVHYIIGFQLWHILLCEAKFRGIGVFAPTLHRNFDLRSSFQLCDFALTIQKSTRFYP